MGDYWQLLVDWFSGIATKIWEFVGDVWPFILGAAIAGIVLYPVLRR